MNVKSKYQSNTSTCANEVLSPSPGRRSGRTDRIEVLSAAQDLRQTESQRAEKLSAATAMKRTVTNHESCSNAGVADVHAPDKFSSDNQQDQRAAVSKSTNKSNIALPTSKVLDVSLIQFEKKQERPIATISDAEQQPDEPTMRNSANANNAISCDAVLGLLSPAWSVALNDEDGEDQRRRRANFVNKRKQHDHSLQAHYNAIFAEVFAAAEADDDDEEEDPQQDDNSEENADSFHDLFIIMEADGGPEDDRESD